MAENPTPTPGEYQREVGSGDQLDSGEATEANTDIQIGDRVEETLDAQQIVGDERFGQDLPEVEYGGEDPEYSPSGKLEEFMFADPEGFTRNAPRQGPSSPIPSSIIRMLPTLALAVQNPNTPAAIKAAYEYVIQRIEAEQRAKF